MFHLSYSGLNTVKSERLRERQRERERERETERERERERDRWRAREVPPGPFHPPR